MKERRKQRETKMNERKIEKQIDTHKETNNKNKKGWEKKERTNE
jgi:hypothetical protein